MLASTTVTFWRWLTGQPMSLASMLPADESGEERRVCLRYAANLNIRCGEAHEQPDPGVSALIRDISRGGIHMVAPQRYEPGTVLSVELPSARGAGGLAVLACVIRAQPHGDSEWAMGCRFCSELDDSQLQTFGAARARPSSPDPRGWSRFSCDTQALVQRVNASDQAHHSARVLNIAVGGMALLVEEPIAVGELLSTELRDAKGQPVVTLLACVVHSQSVAQGQLLGCNFIRELSDADVRALL